MFKRDMKVVRNPYKKPYKQIKNVKYLKSEDDIFMGNNVWNKINEEVEFQRYKDKKKMKELGMFKEDGEYDVEALMKWKAENKVSWVNLSMEDD